MYLKTLDNSNGFITIITRRNDVPHALCLFKNSSVLFIVYRLFFAATINFICHFFRTIHRTIYVRSCFSVSVTNNTSYYLNRQAIKTRRPFFIYVRGNSRERFKRIRAFAGRVRARRCVVGTLAWFVRGLSTFRDIRVTISMITTSIVTRRVFNRFFYRTFNGHNRRCAFFFLSTLLCLFRRIIGLVRAKTCFGCQIRRSNEASGLFGSGTFAFRRFVVNEYNASVGRLFNRFLRLFGF